MNGHRLVILGRNGDTVIYGGVQFGKQCVTLENLSFVNPGKQEQKSAVEAFGPATEIRNCRFKNYRNAIEDRFYSQRSGMILEGNHFEDCETAILCIASGGEKKLPVRIQNNEFRNCGLAWFYLWPHPLFFQENTLIESGLRLDPSPTAVFSRNRFSGMKSMIEFLSKEKTSDGMIFTENTFDREKNHIKYGNDV